MGGFDDHVAIMGDWLAPSPSPRAFFASLISDDMVAKSNAESANDNGTGLHFPAPDKQGAPGNAVEKDGTLMANEESNSNALSEVKTSSCGGLMERMAARAGFNAPRLNTESIRHADLPKNLEVPSPCLTIPPGLSPTTLLDSPVFLPNSLVLPSPTTGKFSFAPIGGYENSSLLSGDPDVVKGNTIEDVNASSFAFKPIAESGSLPHINAVNKVKSSSLSQQPFPSVGPSVLSESRILQHNIEPLRVHCNNDEFSPPLDDPHEDDGDPKSSDPSVGGGPSEDDYNWRKYGQKHVKGSEYPRSYYKCTHANCPVKKKVERSQEGHITEIIYKGAHNHPKPPPNRRSVLGMSNAHGDMQLNAEQSATGANGDLIWSTMQNATPDWRQDNLEATSSARLAQECRHETNALQDQSGTQFGSGDAVDASPTFSNDDDEDDRVTHGSASLGYDGEGDELESKRRRIETYTPEMSGSTRAIREPRVVVQTTSDVDILDDGYRWRKYGQKVVKGNPNPRSYYKCTSTGCNVRKHVERASHDLKSVITTYEGKHNHDVPAARNSSHVNSVGPNPIPTQQASAIPSQIHRPEPPQIRSSTAHFERPPLGSFNLPGRPQIGLPPEFGFGTNQPGLANLGMAGLGSNQGKLPILPVHSYLGNQPAPMNDIGFMLPKGEPKLEPASDSGLNSSNGSSVYQQLMSRLPLGP